jgi:phage baseplate assembly protein W
MAEIPSNVLRQFQEEFGVNSLVIEDFGITSQLAPNGDFNVYRGKELAVYRLAVLLSIVEGSDLMDPNLGVNITKYIYKPMTDDNIEAIKNELERKIERYEKDLRLIKMTVKKDDIKKSLYFNLDLKYTPTDEEVSLDFDFIKTMQALMVRSR